MGRRNIVHPSSEMINAATETVHSSMRLGMTATASLGRIYLLSTRCRLNGFTLACSQPATNSLLRIRIPNLGRPIPTPKLDRRVPLPGS